MFTIILSLLPALLIAFVGASILFLVIVLGICYGVFKKC